jgi:hypothetical protein
MDKTKSLGSVTRYVCVVRYVDKRGHTGFSHVTLTADMDLAAMKLAEGRVRLQVPDAVEIVCVDCRRS